MSAGNGGPVNHRLQLFDSPESLAASVSSFFVDGYGQGANLLVVARPRNLSAILGALRQAGCFPEDRCGNQRLVALNPMETLERISRNGVVDERLFQSVVEPVVERLAATGELFIYGEIVDLLAEQDDFVEATRLEEMWNRLARKHAFTLLCGYSSAHFTARDARPALRDICATHSHVGATPDDALGRWLLAIA